MLIESAIVVGGAAFAAYHATSPESNLYGKPFRGTPGQGKQLTMTYDDGPNDVHTPNLLDVLAEHNVKATFFLIGKFVEQRPEMVRRMAAEGHIVANHTYTHPNLAWCGQRKLRDELNRCKNAIEQVLGKELPRFTVRGEQRMLFRTPFGGRNPSTLHIVRDMGYEPIMWSIWAYDWLEGTTPEIVQQRVSKKVRGGDVI